MKLLRLLADLEPRRRDDVALLFVRTSECPASRILEDVIARCAEVFHVESVVLRPDTTSRRARWGELNKWPVGCNVLWNGAVEYFLRSMSPCWTTIFTVDGGDGVPLHRDWADLLVEDHGRTLGAGLLVTGGVLQDGVGRWHVNGNMVVERRFLLKHPEVLVMPEEGSWDVWHAASFLPAARASSVVRCDWRGFGLRPGSFSTVAEHSAWWHGCKDGDFVQRAREFILGSGGPRPSMLDFGKASDLVVGGVAS